MGIFKLCIPYLKNYKIPLTFYFLATIIVGLLILINPLLIGDFVDNLVMGGGMAVIYRFAVIFATINILRTLLSFVSMITYTRTQSKAAYLFSQETISHFQKLSASYLGKNDSNYISQVINGDTNMLIIFCITFVYNFMLNGIYLVVPVIVLFSLNYMMTIVLLFFLFAYVLVYVNFKKPLYEMGMELRVEQNTFFSRLLEQLKLTKFIKMHSSGMFFRSKMDRIFDGLLESTIKYQKLNFFYTAMDTAVTTVVQIVLFVFGGWLVLRGYFTIGMFTVFSMYFNMMLGACKYFFGFGKLYQSNMVSYNRLMEIKKQKADTFGNILIKNVAKIEIRNLSFSYEAKDSVAACINNLSVSFEKGRLYCIVGQNGAGKSTLVELLMGMYIDEREGEVYFNGISSAQIDLYSLRHEAIGITEQSPTFFEGGVFENVFLHQNSAVESDLNRYISLLSLEGIWNDPANQEQISIQNLSGGEQQKLSILRLLCKGTSVMIFDEPTSALDSASIVQFTELLHELKREKIIMVITHDNYVIQTSDVIVNL